MGTWRLLCRDCWCSSCFSTWQFGRRNSHQNIYRLPQIFGWKKESIGGNYLCLEKSTLWTHASHPIMVEEVKIGTKKEIGIWAVSKWYLPAIKDWQGRESFLDCLSWQLFCHQKTTTSKRRWPTLKRFSTLHAGKMWRTSLDTRFRGKGAKSCFLSLTQLKSCGINSKEKSKMKKKTFQHHPQVTWFLVWKKRKGSPTTSKESINQEMASSSTFWNTHDQNFQTMWENCQKEWTKLTKHIKKHSTVPSNSLSKFNTDSKFSSQRRKHLHGSWMDTAILILQMILTFIEVSVDLWFICVELWYLGDPRDQEAWHSHPQEQSTWQYLNWLQKSFLKT